MPEFQCSVDGCNGAKLGGFGLCMKHYKRTRPRTPDKPRLVNCVVCNAEILRSRSSRVYGFACSSACRRTLQFGDATELPPDHMARWVGQFCTWTAPAAPRPTFQSGLCRECGHLIVEPAGQTRSTYCSVRCVRRTARRKRRAREHDAPGEYTFTEVMRQYRKQGMVCAYCKTPCAYLPDPEHVTPLSRGGRNDMSNIVAACRTCNGQKRDLTLDEWALDRIVRGLPPVDTTLGGPAFTHLWRAAPSTPAHRPTRETAAA